MSNQTHRAALALEIFNTNHGHFDNFFDPLNNCLRGIKHVNELLSEAASNAVFRGDNLSLEAIGQTCHVVTDLVRMAEVISEHWQQAQPSPRLSDLPTPAPAHPHIQQGRG